ncbi:Transmembrane component CbrV of energizing module of predicted cobalamin ECF transporter [Paenibacillus pasadenensis]|uniref:Transmembrane component CbrV of energizing module of predicted cobalamin ECF transporter n=1 Tax=Paenibacillus pasadenensis TaxID=217090 RepID=A0A2N5NBJ4_9BACL|nr:CbiQ family ECF transporter T component [Paenibacillus pasadenensis]PLT47726.1 Transmembrane component CbrV of energizing module of predicted cobalamin ECF transporter [Paenibacillus pasadenensis]
MVFGFASLHPRVSFAYFALLLLCCMLLRHPVLLAATLAAALLLNLSLDGGRRLRRSLPAYLLIALLAAVANPLFSSRGETILFYLRDRPVTLEAIAYGGLSAAALLSLLLVFTAFNLVLDSGRLLRLLAPVAPQTAFAVTVSMRFVPLLTRRLGEIRSVQRALGDLPEGMGRRRYLREGMETLHALVAWSLEEALQTALSMRARGYGIGPRSSADVSRLDGRDWAFLWALLLLGCNILIGRVSGVHAYEAYPRLEPLQETPLGWVHLGCYLLFLALPVLMNGKERLHWRLIRSKM